MELQTLGLAGLWLASLAGCAAICLRLRRPAGPLPPADWPPTGVLGDESLRAALAQARAVQDSIPDRLAVLDAQGRVLSVNATWVRAVAGIAGSNPELIVLPHAGDDYIGACRALGDAGNPPSAAEADGIAAVLAGRAENFVLEYPSRLQPGKRWYELRVTPLRLPGGGVVVCHSDITARWLAAAEIERTAKLQLLIEALSESERFIRTVADNQPTMVSYWDAGLRCRFANRAYREWFGISEERMQGIALAELLTPEAVTVNLFFLQAAMRGERQRFQRDALSHGGRKAALMVDCIPDQREGRVLGCLLVVSDITEAQAAQTRLQQANYELVLARDRAEAADRAKSAFLANTGHEIRTPMNAILGLTRLMQREIAEPAAQARLAKVHDAASRLMQVMDDILDLSKIESGQLQLADKNFALRPVLNRCLLQVAEKAMSKGLAVSVQAERLPELLRGDASRLTQALLNLLENAVKFTESGTVVLRVEELADVPAPGCRLRFTVQDSGIGIASDQLKGLFSAFVQADDSTTRRHGGTGLGLALTQRLARLMGGEVGVSSQEGLGSQFWFTAVFKPAAAVQAASNDTLDEAESRLRRHHAGARVLLAEDNPINQEVAKALLEAVGLEVGLAANGHEAVQRVQAEPWDLVLMDMQMPGLDGLQATRQIRSGAVRPRIPILAMTAHAFSDERAACLAAGMDGHVPKPVDPLVLYAELLKWLPERTRGSATEQGAEDGRPALGKAPPIALTPLSEAALDRLVVLLHSADFQALTVYREVSPALLQRFGSSALAELEAGLNEFDFERAYAALLALRATEPAPA